jgi:hypothetical protein
MTTFNDGESAEGFRLIEYRQEFDQIENDYDRFRWILHEQKNNGKQYLWLQKIDQWENDSIEKIKQTAEKCRNKLINYTKKVFSELENQQNHLVTEFKRIRQENEFHRIDLNKLKNKFNKLKQEFNQLTKISIEEQSTLFISKIFVKDSEY